MTSWAAWVRTTYQTSQTDDELLRLITEADERYRQARDSIAAEGLKLEDGRINPAVAIERDTRAAISRLIVQLDLEDNTDAKTTEKTPAARLERFPRRVG